jgi:hypothetical protein
MTTTTNSSRIATQRYMTTLPVKGLKVEFLVNVARME